MNLKGSVISNTDPSGTSFTAAVRALLPHSLRMCLHDAGEGEGRWRAALGGSNHHRTVWKEEAASKRKSKRKERTLFNRSFSRWMCEVSDSMLLEPLRSYEPNGLNICTRCIGAQTNPFLPLCHLLSLFSLPVSFSVLFFLLKPCLKHLDRPELNCPKTSAKS